jgi:hypothetical protein
MIAMSSVRNSAAALLFVCGASGAQTPPVLFDELPPGTYGVGFRLVPLGDGEGRMVHVWYPTGARDRTCLSFGDYLGFDRSSASPLTEARERLSATFGSMDDERWRTLTSQRLRACENADPAGGRHPLLVSMYSSGNMTFHGEYFASHGYVVALVTNAPGGRPPPGDMTAFVATQIERQTASLEVLVRRAGAESFVDTARIGVLGQAPSTFLFAMRNAALVDAVTLQDSDIFSPGLSPNALRLATGWRPGDMRVPFLHVINNGSLAAESLRRDLLDMRASERYRLILNVAYTGHEDLTGVGYVARRVLDPRGQDSLIRAFEATVRTQHAFLDAYVRGDARRRQVLDRAERTLVAPAVGRIELIAAERR